MKKILKKNQVIIYIIALMLMTAGYLNYTTNVDNKSVETSMKMESSDDMQIADIGDATLVNSNDVVSETNENQVSNNEITDNTNNENTTNTNNSNTINQENNNTTSEIEDKEIFENSNETIVTNSSNNSDYFIKSKLERNTMYSQMLETYEKVLNSSNSLETQKQSATQEITKINETKNSIMICENLISTKGFENNIIFVNGESISVIIEAEELKPEEVAQIQNIISREMKAEIENIHIATK